jgi:hypothetical protein
MKNFSLRIFLFSSLVIGLLTFISMMAGWDLSDKAAETSLFWNILAKSFFVFNWALMLIDWLTGDNPNETLFIVGIFLNCLLDGFIIERIFYLFHKKQKPPVVYTK